MKAIVADFSIKREAWDRVRSRLMRGGRESHGITMDLTEIPEPTFTSPNWVKVRSIMSGISTMDEGMVLHHDLSAFGASLSFPFVPGNENVGIVTEVGRNVENLDLGERVIVDPLLSCEPREAQPVCSACSRGEPAYCRNFFQGIIGSGMLIGACRDTGGGWGDYFTAAASRLRPIPQDMDSDHAVLMPEFSRAVKAVLRNPPGTGDRVVIVGGGSLGIMVLLALDMLGHDQPILVVVEHPFEVDLVRRLSDASVVLAHSPGAAFEGVAEFVQCEVLYPKVGRITLAGGADLVYETTGTADRIEDAMSFTGEGKRLVLSALNQTSGFDMSPLWFKGIHIEGVGFSGRELYDGDMVHVLDIAVDLARKHSFPVAELITHRFSLSEHRQAFAALASRSTSKAVKIIFQHVV
ncbi:MAG: alcohol dehydrogenase catalytic domain-containing protein [Desulfomonilaceae bacterium]|nr:alcohol dehydrogenase catalytic domain-containing protein [Desulfomonilaceae bacterium]